MGETHLDGRNGNTQWILIVKLARVVCPLLVRRPQILFRSRSVRAVRVRGGKGRAMLSKMVGAGRNGPMKARASCILLVLCLAIGSSEATSARAALTRNVRIRLVPNPIRIGQTLAVRVTDARPRGRYGFEIVWHRSPHNIVLDLGRYTASSYGTIRFRPVTFTLREQSGLYMLRGFEVHGKHLTLVTTARLVVLP